MFFGSRGLFIDISIVSPTSCWLKNPQKFQPFSKNESLIFTGFIKWDPFGGIKLDANVAGNFQRFPI